MEQLPGIDIDRVRLFGERYLPLILQVSEQFRAMQPKPQRRSAGSKSSGHFITISDDEDDDDEGMIDEDLNSLHDGFDGADEHLQEGGSASEFNTEGAAFAERRKFP